MPVPFAHLTTILPGHGIEDFPFYLSREEAEAVLTAWTAAWHPSLMVAVGQAPNWSPAIYPPDASEPGLILLPEPARRELSSDWMEQAETAGSVIVDASGPRQSLVADLLDRLAVKSSEVAEELVPDFFALGFSYLQVELLTRAMRYSSHLDAEFLRSEAFAAGLAAIQEDRAEAQRLLTVCFDSLADARNHFYPVDAYLIDIVLTADTTLGVDLLAELEATPEVPSNLLLSGSHLAQMAASEPQSLASLRQRLQAGTLGLAGGEFSAAEMGLVDRETLLSELLRGRASYCQHLDSPVRVFGRSSWGMAPYLPDLLVRLGFEGALHLAFDGQSLPAAGQAKFPWQGLSSLTIPAVAAPPRDAADPQALLQFAQKLGSTMDDDHVATLVYAHWPNQVCPWYEDLRRSNRYGPALGKFVSLPDYFANSQLPPASSPLSPDSYRSPRLVRDVRQGASDPVSRHVRCHVSEQERRAAASLQMMAAVAAAPEGEAVEEQPPNVASATQMLARSVGARATEENGQGRLLINPTTSPWRNLVSLPQPPAAAEHVRLVAAAPGACDTIVDIPPYGYAWVGGNGSTPAPSSSETPVATEAMLQNEFFQVELDPASGGIRGLRSYRHRDRLLTTQLVVCRGSDGRWPQAEQRARMKLDTCELMRSAGLVGEVVSRGRLVDLEEQPLADFEQTLRLERGSRVLHMKFLLTPHLEWNATGGGPWQNYLGLRLSWDDPTAKLCHSVGGCAIPTRARRFIARDFVEVRQAVARLTLLTGGLPFHRRRGDRALDTLMVTAGETRQQFSLGIGWDLPAPWSADAQLVLPGERLNLATGAPQLPHAWLAHLHPHTVQATAWEQTRHGFRVRLLESAGRRCQVRLRTARPVARSWTTDFEGKADRDLLVEEGTIIMDCDPYQWAQVEAEWAALPSPRGAS